MQKVTWKQISKETFQKFKKIRTVKNIYMDEYDLHTKDGVRYIVKQLPSQYQFYTIRPQNILLHKYVSPVKYTSSYIYPILGSSIEAIMRSNFFQNKDTVENRNNKSQNSDEQRQFDEWLRCNENSFQKCIEELIKFALQLPKKYPNLDEINLEYVRIVNGRIIYCYDSWMNSVQEILLKNPNQLQRYFLSENELKKFQEKFKNSLLTIDGQQITFDYSQHKNDENLNLVDHKKYFDYTQKIMLFALNLGTIQLNLRNYQWGLFKYNKDNITKRIKYFEEKYHKQKISKFIATILLNSNQLRSHINQFNSYNEIQAIQSVLVNFYMDCSKNIAESRASHRSDFSMKCTSNMKQKLKRNRTASNYTNFKQQISVESKILTKNSLTIQNNLKNQTNIRSNDSTFKQNPQYKKSLYLTDCYQMQKIKAPQRVKIQKPFIKDRQSHQIQSNNTKDNFTIQNIKQILSSVSQSSLKKRNIKLLQILNLDSYIPQSKLEELIILVCQEIQLKKNFRKILYSNNSLYLGELSDNEQKRQGLGLYIFPEGTFYHGQWKNDQIEGLGTYIFSNGDLYKGQCKNGKKQGFGVFTDHNQIKYEGFWKNNDKLGLGTVYFDDKMKFCGEFSTEKKQIDGIFTGYNKQTNIPWTRIGILTEYKQLLQQLKGSKQSSPYSLKTHSTIDSHPILNLQQNQQRLITQYNIKGQWKNGMLISYEPLILV